MRYSTLLSFVILNLFSFRSADAQTDFRETDSVDAVIIHYEEINNNDPNILDYLTVITMNHVVVIEKRGVFDDFRIQKRIYPFDADWHTFQSSNSGSSSLEKNVDLKPVQLDLLDSLEIAGHTCTAANYTSRNKELKAYYTDAYGIRFSTTANYPGLALYYEKEMMYGISKYQADWIKKGKITSRLLIDLQVYLQTEEKKNTELIELFKQYDHKISHARTWSSGGNWDYKLNYSRSDGEQVYAQNLYGSIVIGTFAETFAQANETVLPLFKKIISQFPDQPIKYILFTEEKKKDIDPNVHLQFPSSIDIVPSGRRYLKKLKLDKSTKVVILDRALNYHSSFTDFDDIDMSIIQTLETCLNTQYYHGYLNPMTQ